MTPTLVTTKFLIAAHKTEAAAESYYRLIGGVLTAMQPNRVFANPNEPLLIVKYVVDKELGSAYNATFPRLCLYTLLNIHGNVGYLELKLHHDEDPISAIGNPMA